ncbi:hypothetical protein LTLLF_177330 [Microtus ochrogaster]|uniref:Uncharacterized protein n=1 Tax=Microtus ochrogaster TaxID=79684 RepID=A0A8J6KNZ4_MICOH|nr:hypothetical protein LTLLF_177330 [Microtus ochrogaster]
MNLPNEDLWDETNCSSAVCQHPQCWASLRRIERGHPRILDSPGKSSREIDDKLPTLTIVNITDSCLWTKKRMAQRQSPKFTFPKERERSLLLKPASRRYSRSQKAFYDKGVASCSRPPKLSVLNLNEAKLPFSEDVRNMVVTWVPEEMEKNVSILAHEKTMTCPEVKIELAKMKKNLPLERTRPNSALSSKMYLTVHRLTLQRPSLRYPEHLRKLQYNLKRAEGSSGYKKQQKQQQRKVKTSTEMQCTFLPEILDCFITLMTSEMSLYNMNFLIL